MSQSTQTPGARRTLAELLAERQRLTLEETGAIILDLLEAVGRLHDDGSIHGRIGADTVTVDEALRTRLPEPATSVEIDDADGADDAFPLPLRGLPPLSLPTRIDAAERLLAEAGVRTDPRQIDLHQLGALTCLAASGSPASLYLRSPRAKSEVPAPLRPIIDRALGADAGAPLEGCQQFAAALHALTTDVAASTPAPASGQASSAPGLPFERLGHYRIVGRIGHGGMGDVYKAYEEQLDRTVAIKVLPSEFGRNEDFVRRFRVEAAAIAKLVHPNVVQIYFAGEDESRHFFAMQHVDGETLADLLARRGRLDVDETLRIVEQCLAGLGAAHEIGLVHRDVKPANLLLDKVTRRVLVADFGLVKAIEDATRITMTGMVMGTADYLAPEQARGRDVDHRADLYAVGVMTYQMLAGRLPFQANSTTAMMFQHAYETPPALESLSGDVPARLAAVVMKLMAKEPADRYQSAAETLADFAGATGRARGRTDVAAIARELPPIPAELSNLVQDDWWGRVRSRAGDWLAKIAGRAPGLVARWQGTRLQVDAAVAEYERRRSELQVMQKEAASVASDLEREANDREQAASSHQARVEAASHEASRKEALDAVSRDRQQAAELAELAAEQRAHEEEIGLRLARVDATLVRIRAQRNALAARLDAAEAQVARDADPAYRRMKFAVITATCVVLVLVVALLRPGPKSDAPTDAPTDAPSVATSSPAPLQKAAPPSYMMHELGAFGPFDLDDSGMLGGSFRFPAGHRAAAYQAGRIIDLGVPAAPYISRLSGAGHAVGVCRIGKLFACFFTTLSGGDGQVQMDTFGEPGVSRAVDVNSEGWVVVRDDENQNDRTPPVSYLWHRDRDPVPIEGGRDVRAFDINDRRQVAGWRFRPEVRRYEGFIWKDGVMYDVGRPDGWAHSGVEAINHAGHAVGWVSKDHPPDGINITGAFSSEAGVLGTLGGRRSQAIDVNDTDVIVGDAAIESGEMHAFVWIDGVMHDLNDLVVNRGEWVFASGRRVSNDGRILARADQGYLSGNFLLHPDGLAGGIYTMPDLPVDQTPVDTPVMLQYYGALEIGRLAEGERVYTDRDCVFDDIPPELSGGQFLRDGMHAGADRHRFKSLEPGHVYVATLVDPEDFIVRDAIRSLATESWIPTGLRIGFSGSESGTLQVWMREVEGVSGAGSELIPEDRVFLAAGFVLVPPSKQGAPRMVKYSSPD
ncbi:MAG: hypothetical protein CMJ18_19050 [Phycisphaeraceae bacterium]|nr:hypothetical protein [Phycisphaeraceae bacterium]